MFLDEASLTPVLPTHGARARGSAKDGAGIGLDVPLQCSFLLDCGKWW